MTGNITTRLSQIFYWTTGLTLGVIILPIVILKLLGWSFPSYPSAGYEWLVVVMSIATAIVLLVFFMYAPRLSRRQANYLFAFMAFLAVATEAIVVHALASYGHTWDAGTVDVIARHYATNGTTVMPGAWEDTYLAKYDNNIPITLLLSLVYSGAGHLFGPHFSLYSQIINSVAILASVCLLVFVAWKLYGRRAALLAFTAGYALILLSSYTPITYTDTLGMFFVISIVTCALMASRTRGYGYLVWPILFGLTMYCGYLIKPTVIFIGGAIVAVAILKYITQPRLYYLRKLGIIATSVVCGLIIGFGGYQTALHVTPNFADYTDAQINTYKTPVEHYLAMGGLRGLEPYSECSEGKFCIQFVEYIQSGDATVATLNDRRAYSLELWKASVNYDFPFGYIGHLVNKTLLNYSDGSFGAWGEGSNDGIIFRSSSSYLDQPVRSVLGPHGDNRDAFRMFLQVVWLAVLLFIAVGAILLWRDRDFRIDFWQNCFRLAVLLVTFFLMVFEARPRYLFLYVPIFILMTVGTIVLIGNRRRGLFSKQRRDT